MIVPDYSQHGEGQLVAALLRYAGATGLAVEMGSGTGDSSVTRGVLEAGLCDRGLWLERKAKRADCAARLWEARQHDIGLSGAAPYSVDVRCEVATPELDWLSRLGRRPAVVSVDIDSYDWFVVRGMLAQGVRPVVWCLEYNPTLGRRALTIPYKAPISDELRNLYYGCSVGAWRTLLHAYGYRFVTVDAGGANALFVSPVVPGLPPGPRRQFADCWRARLGPRAVRWRVLRERRLPLRWVRGTIDLPYDLLAPQES